MNLFAVTAIEWFIVFFFGLRKNVEHVPDGQCILVANHNSSLDTYVLASLLSPEHKRKTRAVAAKDTFAAGWGGWFARWSLDAVLVERHPHGSRDPLADVKQLLADGWSLILYPEGTRGEPGKMASFKRGIGVLATDHPDLPIYPVFIKGVERCLARDEYLVVPFEIAIQVAEQPVYGRDFLQQAGDKREVSKLIARALEDAVRAMG
jgi:1-acyl-sn-glycerol-3-phosphate acyltransferase